MNVEYVLNKNQQWTRHFLSENITQLIIVIILISEYKKIHELLPSINGSSCESIEPLVDPTFESLGKYSTQNTLIRNPKR